MSQTTIHTRYGDIYPTQGACRDNYPNIHTMQNAAGQLVKMQEPALRALRNAELRRGRKLPWRDHRKPKAIRITGIGWRSCADQTTLHNGDPSRFADPNFSRHCRGLAIDVENTLTNLTRRTKRCLEAEGFHQSVPGEVWHFSYYEVG